MVLGLSARADTDPFGDAPPTNGSGMDFSGVRTSGLAWWATHSDAATPCAPSQCCTGADVPQCAGKSEPAGAQQA